MYELPEQGGSSTVIVRASDITGETKPEIVPVAVGSQGIEELA